MQFSNEGVDGVTGPKVVETGRTEDVSSVLLWDVHHSGLSAQLYIEVCSPEMDLMSTQLLANRICYFFNKYITLFFVL